MNSNLKFKFYYKHLIIISFRFNHIEPKKMSQSLDNIIIIPRPAYSSERYYLLSELEQICSFPGTIHDSALLSTSSTSITPPRGLVMLYLLLKLDSNFINNSDFEEIDKVSALQGFVCILVHILNCLSVHL